MSNMESAELAATIELQDRKTDPLEDKLEDAEEPPTESKNTNQLQVPVSGDTSVANSTGAPPKRLRVLRVRRLKSLVDSYDNLGDQRLSDPFRDEESDYLMESLEASISFSGMAQDLDRRRKKSKLLCEAFIFIPFYFLFILMLSLNRDVHNSYLLENAIESRLLDHTTTATDGTSIGFNDVTTFSYFWDWFTYSFIPIVLRDDWYNNDDLNRDLWHTIGYQTRLVGGFRLQQKRGKTNAGAFCYDSPFDDLAPTCQSKILNKNDIECNNRSDCAFVGNSTAFHYRCDEWDFCGFFEEFNFYSYEQSNSTGTVTDLLSVSVAQQEAENLRTNRWIDESTRSVYIKANFYNSNFKTWVVVTFKFKCSLSGQIIAIDSNHAAIRLDILNTNSPSDVGMLILGIFYLISVFVFAFYLFYKFYYHFKNDVEMIIDEDEEFDNEMNESNENNIGNYNNSSPNLNDRNNSNDNIAGTSNNNNSGNNIKFRDMSATETVPSQTQTQTQVSQTQQSQTQSQTQTREQFEQSHDRHHGSRLKVKRVRKVSYFNKWDWFKRSFLNILLLLSNLCVIITFFIFVFDETRLDCINWKKSSSKVDFDSYVPLEDLVDIDDTFRSFVVITLMLLTLSSVRYFQITNSGEAVFMALMNAIPIVFSYLPIYLLSLLGFAIAGHWLFGMELEEFSNISLAFFSVVQLNFGLLDISELWGSNWVGNLYILTTLLVFIPFLLNIFLAITINSWDDFLQFRKQLRNPINSGISPVSLMDTLKTVWYQLPLVPIREQLLKMLLEDKLDYNQVTSRQVRQICGDLKLNEVKTNLVLKFFWKLEQTLHH